VGLADFAAPSGIAFHWREQGLENQFQSAGFFADPSASVRTQATCAGGLISTREHAAALPFVFALIRREMLTPWPWGWRKEAAGEREVGGWRARALRVPVGSLHPPEQHFWARAQVQLRF